MSVAPGMGQGRPHSPTPRGAAREGLARTARCERRVTARAAQEGLRRRRPPRCPRGAAGLRSGWAKPQARARDCAGRAQAQQTVRRDGSVHIRAWEDAQW